MPPRGKRKVDSDSDDDFDECSRLRQLAQDTKICSKQRRVSVLETQQLPKHLASADGKDILKKSSTRKGRYLFHFSAEFQPVVGGRMGTLAKLDSKNPVLYIDFPWGRLKLIGTLLFPKAKYLLLKFGAKDVLCEDIFDSVVLFAEMHWIGTKEANPSEAPLAMPDDLQNEIVREPAAGDVVADGEPQPAHRRQSPALQPASQQPASQADTQPASQRSRGGSEPRPAQKRRRDAIVLDESSDDADSAAEEADPPESQRQHLGRSSKSAAQKKLLEFEEEDDDDADASGNSGSEGSDAGRGSNADDGAASAPDSSPEPVIRGSQAASAKKPAGGGKRPVSSQAAESPSKRQKQQPAAGRKAARKIASSSEESGDEEAGDDDEEPDDDDDDSDFSG